jgi:hypothetical protein
MILHMNTRILAATCCLAGILVAGEADPGPAAARAAIETLHRELTGRFSEVHGLLYDYTAADGSVLLPTADEFRAGKPNALGWRTPVANGAFFSGLWLAALVDRWEATRDSAVAERARRLAAGLLLLASVGRHPAFIARGLSADGQGHPLVGSDDQTLPWFYGLWRYLKSPLPTTTERAALLEAVLRVGSALRDNRWQIPSEPPLGPRGSFSNATPVTAPRLLFMVRAMHDLTGDAAWLGLYRRLRDERPRADGPSRLEACADGDLIGEHATPAWNFYMLWTKGHSVACLAALARWEEDPAMAARYRNGLLRIATFASGRIALGSWDPAALPIFQADWRPLLETWREQPDMDTVNTVAATQTRAWEGLSPRTNHEMVNMAEPLFACWIVSLSDDAALVGSNAPAIRATLCRYRWSDLRYSTCLAGELAWWQGRRWLE